MTQIAVNITVPTWAAIAIIAMLTISIILSGIRTLYSAIWLRLQREHEQREKKASAQKPSSAPFNVHMQEKP